MKICGAIILSLCLAQYGFAQNQPVRVKQTVGIKKTNHSPKAIIGQLDSQLNKIIERHIAGPNAEATWVKVRKEADDLLLTYFRTGKLMGTTATQAYFIKIGNETMTATDIANHKMILLVGVAIIKPGEFDIIRVEKTCIAE